MAEFFITWQRHPAAWGAAGLVLGAILGTLGAPIFFPNKNIPAANMPLRQSDLSEKNPYTFIDPLIGIQGGNGPTNPIFQPLEDSINGYIQSEKSNGDVTAVSVNFRDITRSGGFYIDPEEQYSPASLLKVPIMMAYFKIAEANPDILKDILTYPGTKDENAQEHFKPSARLVPGHQYTVEDLIEHMIRYSDNNAVTLLVAHLNDTNQDNAFTSLASDLGINNIDLSNDFITVQAYSIFFRVLYNATYLSRTMSERALSLLSQSDFNQGIVAGISSGVPIAHKFGEFTSTAPDGTVVKEELHDCGYIYYPKHTYSLCVMTKGNDFTTLEGVIKKISNLAYESVIEQRD